MFKNHIDLAKHFRHDLASDEYFYHLKAKWVVAGEVMVIDEWVSVSKEVYVDIYRDAEKMFKKQVRESRCLNEDGTRCMEDCKNCPKGKTAREGLPLSLEQLMEAGMPVGDAFSVESYIEGQAWTEALRRAINRLEEKDLRIIILYAEDLSQRKIGKAVGMSQRGVGYRLEKLFSKLAELLKDFR